MKKICSLILIVIAIISTTIYQYYYHDGSPNNIVILDESHELVDTSIKETVSSRILAVYLDEPYYYYLGYDGIGRYDIRNHMLDVLEFEIYGDETGKHKINYSRSKMIVNKKSKLEDFSKETLDNFEKICNDLNIGLPAEIEARQKQYEFYRNFLLTFKIENCTLPKTRQDKTRHN